MCRLKPEQRLDLGKLARKDIPKNLLMEVFSVSRTTVWYWQCEDFRTRFDIKRNSEGKITIEVEATILCLRHNFKWGTARIQQGLDNLPEFMKAELKIILQFEPVQNYDLSRQSINKVLKKWKINGYSKKNKKAWKFFRAKYPNELWQLDLKEFKFEGRKYYLVVCIDDYSRCILLLQLFEHCPTTEEITFALQKLNVKPEKLLTDNGGQFKEQWKKWCKEQRVEAVFAHPYYPQDKGKVERTIRNIAEEYLDLLSQFPKWFNGRCMEEWKCWFNEDRFHRGVKDYPANLYVKN